MNTFQLLKLTGMFGALSVFSVAAHGQIQILQEWQLNDNDGVLLSDADVEVPGGPTFSSDVGSTAMTGDGTLRIRRAAGENMHSQAFLDTSSQQHLRVDLTIAGWNLIGTASEEFRVGFTNATGVQQTADLYVRRTGDDEISMRLAAFGTDAQAGTLEVIPGLGNVREDPVFLRLEYDGINHTYSGAYDLGDGWVPLTVGGNSVVATSPERNAGALRLYATNVFSTEPEEYFDIQSITLTQVPEPSTYALILGLGFGAFAIWRRRRQA